VKQKAPTLNLQEVAREMSRKRKLAVASLLESKRALEQELGQIEQALRKLNYREAAKPSEN
jgi:translation elongation factor EF-Ts